MFEFPPLPLFWATLLLFDPHKERQQSDVTQFIINHENETKLNYR